MGITVKYLDERSNTELATLPMPETAWDRLAWEYEYDRCIQVLGNFGITSFERSNWDARLKLVLEKIT